MSENDDYAEITVDEPITKTRAEWAAEAAKIRRAAETKYSKRAERPAASEPAGDLRAEISDLRGTVSTLVDALKGNAPTTTTPPNAPTRPAAVSPTQPNRVEPNMMSPGSVNIFALQPDQIEAMSPKQTREHFEGILKHVRDMSGLPPRRTPGR